MGCHTQVFIFKEGTISGTRTSYEDHLNENKAKERRPWKAPNSKGKARGFGLKAHIGVDARTGVKLMREYNGGQRSTSREAANFLHGEECFVSAAFCIVCAQKW